MPSLPRPVPARPGAAGPPPACPCPCPGRRGAGPGPLPVRVTHSAGEGKRRAGGGGSSESGSAGHGPAVLALPFAARGTRRGPERWGRRAGKRPRRPAREPASRGRRPCLPARWSGCRRTSAGPPGTRRRSGSTAVRAPQIPGPLPAAWRRPSSAPPSRGVRARVGRGVLRLTSPGCWVRPASTRRLFKGSPRPATPAALQSPPLGRPSAATSRAAPSSSTLWRLRGRLSRRIPAPRPSDPASRRPGRAGPRRVLPGPSHLGPGLPSHGPVPRRGPASRAEQARTLLCNFVCNFKDFVFEGL